MASTQIDFGKGSRITGEAFLRLAAATDEFEGYAHTHAARIAKLADEMAKLFHLARQDRASLRLAALAHDLGEVVMDRDYIKRAGPLSDAERLDLARHPVIGEQEAARAGADRGAQLLVRWHQEWWNGCGYPDALRREQIPLAARILRVADAYASLTDDRPFRRAVTEEDARSHLMDWAGLEFDPRVVRAFLSLGPLDELRSYAKASHALELRSQGPEEVEAPAVASSADGPEAIRPEAIQPEAIQPQHEEEAVRSETAPVEAARSEGEPAQATASAASEAEEGLASEGAGRD